MSVEGTYEINITTPQGPQAMTLDLETSGEELCGKVRQGDESIKLLEPSYDGNHMTFKLQITKPMPLTLTLDGDVDGDRMTGTAAVMGMKLSFDGKRI